MKKILFAAVAALTICASAYTYYQQNSSVALNDLALANVEALAQGEDSTCPNGCLTTPGKCNCRGPRDNEEATWR